MQVRKAEARLVRASPRELFVVGSALVLAAH